MALSPPPPGTIRLGSAGCKLEAPHLAGDTMRICYVAREPSSLEGPLDASDVLLLDALAQAGHEVHLLRSAAPRLQPVGVSDSIVVHDLEVAEGPGGLPGFGSTAARWAWAVHGWLTRKEHLPVFDWVDLPSDGGAGALVANAKRWGTQYAETLVSVRLGSISGEVRRLNRDHRLDLPRMELDHLEATAIRGADVLRGGSQARLDRVGAWAGRTGPTAIVHAPQVPTGVEHRYSASTTVHYQGPLEPRQGLEMLVDAAVHLLELGRTLELDVRGTESGSGPFGRPFSTWLRRSVPERWREQIRIQVLEPEDDPLLPTEGVWCFPTLECPPPPKLMEALAAGAPVLIRDVAVPEDLVTSGGAATFRSGLVSELADALGRLLDDLQQREALGRAARDWVAFQTPQRIVRRLEEMVAAHRGLPASGGRTSSHARTASPAVSVIVPFYNLHTYLPETLASISAQTERDLEVIIVNDGSTDPASHRLLETIEAEGRHRIIHKPNGGLSSARNAGLSVARGEWILPLDADDLIDPAFVERTLSVVRRHPSLAYVTTLVKTFVEDPETPSGVYLPWGLEKDALALTNVASTCTALLSRKAVEDAGGYDEWLTSFEDWDLYCTLAEQGHQGAVIPEFLFYYRQREGSLVRTEVVERRWALMSHLIAKHPRLAEHPDRTLRALMGEHAQDAAQRPLRYRAVDAANDALKRMGVLHHAMKAGWSWLERSLRN